jgi:hypothetical protein
MNQDKATRFQAWIRARQEEAAREQAVHERMAPFLHQAMRMAGPGADDERIARFATDLMREHDPELLRDVILSQVQEEIVEALEPIARLDLDEHGELVWVRKGSGERVAAA